MPSVEHVVDRRLGRETEFRMSDGEIVRGAPMETSFAFGSTHVIVEEEHGDYRWLDVAEVVSIREAA